LAQTQNDTVSMNGWIQVITGVEFNCWQPCWAWHQIRSQ